ncbi:uncharacterized protein ACA1_201060 [Acanthamoeba castellanii str. Neff]|uniref:Uncharacterized protein n=1 Tax=Acanthamoeba castellanii (strain ATCC 30010 / Neff) TaxID=1257118 RepID=L8H2L0_ACACF|nr:uncharacterized protein ACA1_201060 [Acanthamoeba castellanii str. Neff]ELR19749.1 hypothetical protein ACA1_201060 [Acanthamoeba castellanii str. Neff]
MDELRVWAGVRTPAEMLAGYDTTDLSSTTTTTPYAEARASSLVGLFHLDRESRGEGEDESYVALDSSPTGANAAFEGEIEGQAPVWATNFLLAHLTLFIYSAHPNDTFAAQIDVSALNPTEPIYRDGGAAVLVNQGNVITVAEGSQFFVAYFLTTSPVSYTATVRYRAVSYDARAESALVASEWAEIVVRVGVTGCDGQGGEMDWCGVCEGDRCEPYGCDGEGSLLDVCGVCDGYGESCRFSLANWRGYETEELDKSVLFYDLAHLNEAMEAMKCVVDDVTSPLLESDERRISCANVTTALANVKRLQAKTYIYNTLFL